MTQRDEGHNYRDSKNRTIEYKHNQKRNRGRGLMKKITIHWGTDKEDWAKQTYTFENEEQFKYFMMGVDEANGWLEYEVEDEDGNIDR